MTSLHADGIRALAAFRPDGGVVTSCYLDVDGRRHPRRGGYEADLDQMVRHARSGRHDPAPATEDLDAITRYVRDGIDRSHTRGLAVFSCASEGFWEVLALPVPVRNQLVAGHAPAVGQLEAVLQHAEPVGVLLVDRQHTRVLVVELGEITEHDEARDELLRDVDFRDEKARGDTSGKAEDHDRRHVRRAAASAFAVHQRRPLAHLLVGAPPALVGAVEDALHPYLRERLRGRLNLEPTASVEAVRAAVVEVEADLERARERGLVTELRARVDRDDRAVAGLDDVLGALADRRVDHLLVSAGYQEQGWLCQGCGALARIGPACARCGATMAEEPDVVAVAVDNAVLASCRVDVCGESADLDVVGRIGALLRY